MIASVLDPLTAGARTLGIELTPGMQERFRTYHALLLTWNKRINLISRQDTGRIIGYHFLDSLAAIPLISPGALVADLGSGAGLPGIPIRIVRDDIRMTLVEATRKKVLFLDTAIRQLALENTAVCHTRAEAITDLKFDLVLCRLLGKIKDVLPFTAPLLNPRGQIVFYKVTGNDPEMKQAQRVLDRLHLHITEVRDVRLPVPAEILRRLVVVARLS